ncbi:adenylyl cyclase-associated protein 1 [Octopus bimaculoides]|nr:adenylyl cyclase-associated protein 1 [Octopus bimaculoides]
MGLVCLEQLFEGLLTQLGEVQHIMFSCFSFGKIFRKSKSKKILQVTPDSKNCENPIFKSGNGVEPPIVEKVELDLQTKPASVETTTATTDIKKETAADPVASSKENTFTSEAKTKEFKKDIVKKPSSEQPVSSLPFASELIKASQKREKRVASELSKALTIAAEERARLNSGEMSAEQMIKSIERLETAVVSLERVSTRLENIANTSGKLVNTGNSEEVLSPFVVAYDDIIKGPVATFIALSSKINGNVKIQAAMVQEAFNAQRSFLVQVSRSKKPANEQMNHLLNPTSSKLQAIQELREKNRRDPYFNHLSAISESIPALGWVTLNTPVSYIKEMSDSALFYTNRVLKEFKEKDATHVEWTKAWINALKELQSYVKEYHTTGLSWNPQVSIFFLVSSKRFYKISPIKMEELVETEALYIKESAVFRLLNVMSTFLCSPACSLSLSLSLSLSYNFNFASLLGLKKVSDDQKTHKNPTLRKDGACPVKSPANASSKKTPSYGGNAPVTNVPLIELQDKKWIIEYQNNNQNIQLTDTSMKQTVYIYKCRNSVVKVTGKVNSIVVDNSTKCGIVFDDVISSIEFINCSSVQSQVTGKVPTVSIEKTDGCMVYLSPESLDTEIITAKSSEVNVLVPKGDGDYTECFIPEQFKSTWNGTSMSTQFCES